MFPKKHCVLSYKHEDNAFHIQESSASQLQSQDDRSRNRLSTALLSRLNIFAVELLIGTMLLISTEGC